MMVTGWSFDQLKATPRHILDRFLLAKHVASEVDEWRHQQAVDRTKAQSGRG